MPGKQRVSDPSSSQDASRVRDRSSDLSTRESILDAAMTILGRDGMQALTTRAIAREAGVNQALINYHYQTKSNLLLEIARAMETEKYARQSTMYHEEGVPLSTKWRQAVEFYRQDLADGYIRLNQELSYLAITNAAVAEAIAARNRRWLALLEDVAEAYLPPLKIDISPSYVADAIGSFWFGMDQRLLFNVTNSEGEIFEILESIGDWLEERERQYGINSDI